VWLSLLLCHYPDIGKVLLVVRSKGSQDSEARFWTDIAPSEPFAPLRAMHPGAQYEEFLRDKVHVLDADVSKPLCGFSNELRKEIEGTIDAVVNVAGVVDFNPPLDEALLTNAAGCRTSWCSPSPWATCRAAHQHLLRGGLPQRAYGGGRPARAALPVFRTCPTPSGTRTARSSEGLALAASVKKHADDATASRSTSEEAKANLEANRSPPRGRSSPPRCEGARPVASPTRAERRHRAREVLGLDQHLHVHQEPRRAGARGLGAALHHRAPRGDRVVHRLPLPGWNEGINTMAPIMFMFMNGHMQIPASTDAPGSTSSPWTWSPAA
jgi:long-chain acyl-CoA synthetase